MRIVHAANFVAARSGGIRTMLHELGRGYAEAGHQLYAVLPGPANRLEDVGSTRVVTLPAPRLPRSGGYRVLLDRPAVREVLGRVRPDRIEVSDRTTLAWLGREARRLGVPSVAFSHERLDALLRFHLGPALPTAAARRLADRYNTRLAADFDTVVCTTVWAREEFDRIGAANVASVPLGVDLATFTPERRDEAVRRELLAARPHNGPACGHAGADVLVVASVRLSPEKRPDLLVPMLRALLGRGVRARLVVAGEGPHRPAMERAAAGLPVRFLGHVPDRAELARVLAAADVVVAPGPYETFGLAALEAMACGTPVVGAASGALPELLVPFAGPAAGEVAAVDPVALADAVVRVLTAGPNAYAPRRRALGFSWDTTVGAMLGLHAADRPPRPLLSANRS